MFDLDLRHPRVKKNNKTKIKSQFCLANKKWIADSSLETDFSPLLMKVKSTGCLKTEEHNLRDNLQHSAHRVLRDQSDNC